MNRIEHNIKCPSCGQQYSNKEYRGSHIPRILQCGHTCCEVCIKGRSAVTNVCTCPVCKAPQPICDPSSIKDLLVDSYILGNQLQHQKEPADWFAYKSGGVFYTAAKPSSSSKEELRKVPCDECGIQPASCRCDTCPSSYCKACFEQVHKIGKTMRRHKPKPLQRNPEISPQDTLCQEHHRTLEFYCKEDGVLICSFCVVMGGHRTHTVVAVADQNKEAAEEIRPALEEALQSLQGLKRTEKKLGKIRFGIDSYFQMAADNVMTHFHHLHGLLQLRCCQLLDEIKKMNAEYARELQEQGKNISSTLQEFSLLQKEATCIISSSSSAAGNAAFVLEKLKHFKDMPCFLTNDPTSYRPIEQMEFDPALPSALKSYGDVQFAVLQKLNIVPLRDLPEDYVLGEGDDTDTESSSSSYFENNTTEDSSLLCMNQSSEETSNGSSLESYDTLNNKRVIVSHIKDPSHFYVQLCQMVSKLRKMQKDINEYCVGLASKVCSCENSPQVGSLYLAQFGMDRNWYRCRILRSKPSTVDIVEGTSLQQGKGLVEVFYIDYGNSEHIPCARLRQMLPEHKTLPPMAIRCSLYNLVPFRGETWHRSAIRMFATLTVNKNLILKDVERLPGTLFVDLMVADSDDWTSVSDALVFTEMATYHLPDNRIRTQQSSSSRRQYYPPAEFHVGQVLKVLVSAVKSPHEIYIQECGSNLSYLQKMSADLQAHGRSRKSEADLIYVPSIGMACLAFSDQDQMWYRAQVVSLPGGNRVDIWYVDYGFGETARSASIRRIPDAFMKLPVQAILVSMADVEPVESVWSKEAKNRLTKLIINQDLCMKVHVLKEGRPPSVSLYVPGKNDKDICINAVLVKEKLASCVGPISLLVDVPNMMPRKISPDKVSLVHVQRASHKVPVQPIMDPRPSQQQTQSKPSTTGRMTAASALLAAVARKSASPRASPTPQVSKGPGEGFAAALITCIQSPASFFIRYCEDEERWKRLVTETQEAVCSTSDTVDSRITPWQCGQSCAVDHNGLWHRAKVLTIDEDHVDVYLMDTGEVSTLKKDDLAVIPPSLLEHPSFVHKCHLAQIIPAGGSSNWSKTSMEFFEELVFKSDGIYVKEMGEEADGSLPVNLLLEHVKEAEALEPVKKSYKSVRETLKEHGYAFFPKVATQARAPTSLPLFPATVPEAKPTSATSDSPSAMPSSVEIDEPPSEKSCPLVTGAESQSERKDRPVEVAPVSIVPDVEKPEKAERTVLVDQHSDKSSTIDLDSDKSHASVSATVPEAQFCSGSSEGETSSSEEQSSDTVLCKLFEPSTLRNGGAGDAAAKRQSCNEDCSGEKERDSDEEKDGSSDFENFSDEDFTPLMIDEEPVFEWKKRDFPNEKQMMVMPSHIDENAVVYVEVLGEDIAKYKDMKAQLYRVYSARQPEPLRALKRGQACIARYAADHMYYRAKVLGVGEAGIEVQFVDYGTIEHVSPDAIFTDLLFEDTPVLCLEVELYGLKPFSTTGSWPLKVLDTIHYTIVEHNCSMVVKERPSESTRARVHFFLPDGVALHDFLLETGQACTDETISYRETVVDNKTVKQQEHMEEDQDMPWPYQIYHLPAEGIFPVVVSNILNYNTLCIQLNKKISPTSPEEKLVNAMLDSFLAMMQRMREVARNFEPITAPVVGMACCCQYSFDQSWYRAVIRSIHEDEVTVLYVDYGNSESVPFSSLRVLPEEYLDVPMQAVVCTLYGVTPVADTQKVISAMADVLHEEEQEEFLARVKKSEGDMVEIDILNSSLELVYQPLADTGLITINRED